MSDIVPYLECCKLIHCFNGKVREGDKSVKGLMEKKKGGQE
jgi:hypothetical protein